MLKEGAGVKRVILRAGLSSSFQKQCTLHAFLTLKP